MIVVIGGIIPPRWQKVNERMACMKQKLLILMSAVLLLFSGCSSERFLPAEGKGGDSEIEVPETSMLPSEVSEELKLYSIGEPFLSESTGGTGYLSITVDSVNIYKDFAMTDISREDVDEAVGGTLLGGGILLRDEVIEDDGKLKDGYCYIMLDLTITNQDAVGMGEDNVFSISGLAITEKELLLEPDSFLQSNYPELLFTVKESYNISYFNLGLDGEKQAWQYRCPVGESVKARLGFFVKDYTESDETHTLLLFDGIGSYSQNLVDLSLDSGNREGQEAY